MAGGKVFPSEMVPESVASGLGFSHQTATAQSDAETTDSDPDFPSEASSSPPQKLILLEPQRIGLRLKRKRSATPVPAYEFDRRTRINDNERTIRDRKQELQKIFNSVDTNPAQVPMRKKQKRDKLVGALTNTPRPKIQVPREVIMRTEVVSMLPCKGYTLPKANTGNVVYIGGRARAEGLPWMSVVDLYGSYGSELDDDEFDQFNKFGEFDEDGSDEEKSEEDESDENESEEKVPAVNVMNEGGDY